MNHPETVIALREYKKLREYLKSLNYGDCDVRLEYFQLMSTIFDRFHKNFATVDFLKQIVDKKLAGDIVLPNESFKFIFDDYLDKPHRDAYYNDSARSFIIDSWSVFELVVSQLLDYLLNDEEKENFLNKEYKKIKLLLDSEIKSEIKKQKIIRLLKEGQFVKRSITHQSINRRYNKLFSLIKHKYTRQIEQGKEFLRFLGAYRNGLHFNFVYYGNNFNYSFEDLDFKFINGESIETPKKAWEIRVINELLEIAKEIFNCIGKTFIKSTINYVT